MMYGSSSPTSMNRPRSPTFRPTRPRLLSSSDSPKQKSSNCLSILLMVTFFAVGSILSPLHMWGDVTNRRSELLDAARPQHQSTPHSSDSRPITVRSRSYSDTDLEQDDATSEDEDIAAEQTFPEEDPKDSETAEKEIIISDAMPPQTNFSGILARPFEPWTHPLPCFEPDKKWNGMEAAKSSTDKGFLFVKPYKTGSSTTSGINLRIARNVAIRQEANFELCKARFDHGPSFPGHALFKNRNRTQSFLWSVIREPTKRAISHFFHFEVSRKKVEPRDKEFKQFLMERAKSVMTDNYLAVLHTKTKFNRYKEDPIAVANAILDKYDFIGITERMDESAVLVMMLLDLPMSDILYLSAKGKGGFDDGGGPGYGCTYIWPSFLSPGMQKFFDTNEQWLSMVKYDLALYKAANASMDLTIERLGRDRFESLLTQFRNAREVAHSRCLPRTVFPCDSSGELHQKTDCIWKDSGCGVECLDKIAEELGLS